MIKTMVQRATFIGVIGMSIGLLFVVISTSWTGYEIKRECEEAQGQYQTTDCVEAMIRQVSDTTQSYRRRNTAIWILGQHGDSRAKKVLESLYTGVIPPREPYDAGISQYELRKAIKLVNGGVTVVGRTWRFLTIQQ